MEKKKKVYSSKWELLVTDCEATPEQRFSAIRSHDSDIGCLDATRDRRDRRHWDFRNNTCKFFFFKENIREVKMYLRDAETSPRLHWFSVSPFPLICVCGNQILQAIEWHWIHLSQCPNNLEKKWHATDKKTQHSTYTTAWKAWNKKKKITLFCSPDSFKYKQHSLDDQTGKLELVAASCPHSSHCLLLCLFVFKEDSPHQSFGVQGGF